MKKVLCLCLAAALCLLGGCARLLLREYAVSSPHAEQRPVGSKEDTLEARNYVDLKNALLQLVRAGSETGKIRLYDFSGEINREVSRACQEVLREPIGAWAVDYMSPEYTVLPGYTELEISVFYQPGRSVNIPVLAGRAELGETLKASLRGFDTQLVVELGYYDPDSSGWSAAELPLSVYRDNAAFAVGEPAVTVALYPDSGYRRILAYSFVWPDSALALRTRVAQAERACEEIVADLPAGLTEPQTALWLYDALMARVIYDEEAARALREGAVYHGNAGNLYGALVEETALPEGYALAYKQLCDTAGLRCAVVAGARGGDAHTWNIIRLEGAWYHVDSAADDRGETPAHDWFLQPDEVMQETYGWNHATTSRCNSTALTYADLRAEMEQLGLVEPPVSATGEETEETALVEE